jgi:hypothetical protein
MREDVPRPVEIDRAELVPLGTHDEAVSPLQRVVDAGRQLQVRELGLRVGSGLGIVADHRGLLVDQLPCQRERRREANVVGLRLEGQTQQRDALVLEVPERVFHLLDRGDDRLVVDALHLPKQAEVVPEPSGEAFEGLEILREAVPAPAQPGVEERSSDTWIAPHHVRHGRDVRVGPLTQPRERVHVRDLHGQEGVARMLGELGRPDVGLDDPGTVADERFVEPPHDLERPLGPSADEDTPRLERVLDRLPLAKELGVGDDLDVVRQIGALERQDLPQPLRGSGGHGRLLDHDDRAREVLGECARRALDRDEVCLSRNPRGSPHADEDDLSLGHRVVGSDLEAEAPRAHPLLDQLRQPGLVERADALPEQADLLLVLVDSHHVVVERGERRCREQPHMPGSDDRYAHTQPPGIHRFDRTRHRSRPCRNRPPV